MTQEQDGIEAVKSTNPLLERKNRLPGTSIRLPSCGIFYTNNELDPECTDGQIQLFPMTVTDEIIMRSVDMLFQGTAIESVIKRCAPQVKQPLDLLVGDIDYILTNLRKISYGTHIPMIITCDCLAADKEKAEKALQAGECEYLIPVDHFIRNSVELNVKDYIKNFTVTLPTGEHIKLNPLRFKDFITLQRLDDPEALKEYKNVEEYVATNFASFTSDVDGVTNKEFIKEWYKSLPRLHSELIKQKLNGVDHWGIEFEYTITCRHCSKKKELKTQLNPTYFFTLPSSPETLSPKGDTSTI